MVVSVIGGTGPQGLGIALRLAIEGVEVIVGSRKEEKNIPTMTYPRCVVWQTKMQQKKETS